MKTFSFFSRVSHQFFTEWRHLWIFVLLWLSLLALSKWSGIGGFGIWILVVPLLAAATVVWKSVSADLPANSDTFTLSRPIGRFALWMGKVIFLTTSVVVPILLVTAIGWRGFELGMSQWIVMGASVILIAGLLCAFVGGLTSLASTPRQVLFLAILTVVGTGIWIAIQPWLARQENELTLEGIYTNYCGNLIGGIIAIVGLVSGWFLASVPRRRITAGVVCVVSLIVSNWVARTWDSEWISRSPQEYAKASRLELKLGAFDPKAERPGRRLWPTLRIAGLGKDEVATVLEFAPVEEGEEWPPEGSHTDIPTTERGWGSWANHEHVRALFKHYPATTLWQSSVSNDVMYNGRPSLEQILMKLQSDRAGAIAKTWRLKLIVHEMVRLESMPYRQLWSQENQLLLRPGVRVDLESFARQHNAWEMHGMLRRVSSAVLPPQPFAMPYHRKRFVGDDFFLVLVDREMRENRVESPNLYARKLQQPSWTNPTGQWVAQEAQHLEFRLWQPRDQKAFLNRKHDEWIDSQDADFWYAAERGMVEFELTPEEMAEVIPKPEENKS